MKITNYKWFKFYSKNQIGIKANNRTFYPTRRKAKSCKNCQFFNINDICDIGVEIKNSKPIDICFPCNSNKSSFRGDETDGNILLEKIMDLCKKEDYYMNLDLDELIK